MTPKAAEAPRPRTMLVDREKVAEALASLPCPGALDEAIVMTVAEWYADGRLVLSEAATAERERAERLVRDAINALPGLNSPAGYEGSMVGRDAAVDAARTALSGGTER